MLSSSSASGHRLWWSDISRRVLSSWLAFFDRSGCLEHFLDRRFFFNFRGRGLLLLGSRLSLSLASRLYSLLRTSAFPSLNLDRFFLFYLFYRALLAS